MPLDTTPDFVVPVAREPRWLSILAVPAISASRLAIFRAILGFAFLLILLYDPIRAIPREVQHAYSPLADAAWVHAVGASTAATLALQLIGCAAATAFALGVRARISYVTLVAVLLVHTFVLLLRRGVHDWDLPIVTLIALILVPWGDAPPLWQLGRARRDGATEVSPAYGFAIWLPGFTIGLAFAAAAYAKLHRSGLEWVTGGAVRYHFVDDGRNAPFTLGLWVATHPRVAVVLALAAVLVETLFILVVVARGWRARAAIGLAGFGLMAGFFVFQGVYWFPWLILFTAFLPWNRGIDGPRGPVSSARRCLTPLHAVVLIVLVSAQVYASYRAIEIEPLLTNFPMYSITYQSPEHFERSREQLLFEAGGVDITDHVREAMGAATLEAIARQPAQAGGPGGELSAALAEFRARYTMLYGACPPAIDVALLRRNPFDWQAGRYLPEMRERLGTVRLSERPL